MHTALTGAIQEFDRQFEAGYPVGKDPVMTRQECDVFNALVVAIVDELGFEECLHPTIYKKVTLMGLTGPAKDAVIMYVRQLAEYRKAPIGPVPPRIRMVRSPDTGIDAVAITGAALIRYLVDHELL